MAVVRGRGLRVAVVVGVIEAGRDWTFSLGLETALEVEERCGILRRRRRVWLGR